MNNFLTLCSSSFTSANDFVLGNESVDLDSVVSALAFAYFETFTTNKIVVPIINCNGSVFHIRKEILYLCHICDINVSKFVFLDGIHFDVIKNLTLVDHNKLATHQSNLSPKVVRIIDHHKDEGFECQSKIIETCASCCSLIARHYIKILPKVDTSILKMMMFTILVDSHKFEPLLNKAQSIDLSILGTLDKLCTIEKDALRKIYDNIIQLKCDCSDISFKHQLKRDYKEILTEHHRIGFSSLMKSTLDLNQEKLLKFVKKTGISMLFVMGFCVTHSSRDLCIVCENSKLCDKVSIFLQMSPELQLVPHIDTPFVKMYQQLNLMSSRKQLLPLVVQFFNTLTV